MTIASLITSVTGAMSTILPDFSVYAATGLVVGLAVVAVRRLVKGLR
jgi:uncharacterized membrane protein (Fun14 family)